MRTPKRAARASVDEDMVQEAEELKSVLALVSSSKEEVEAHNVSHWRSWCSACGRGRWLSLGHHKVDAKTEAEELPTVSFDLRFFGQPRGHSTRYTSSAHRAGAQE